MWCGRYGETAHCLNAGDVKINVLSWKTADSRMLDSRMISNGYAWKKVKLWRCLVGNVSDVKWYSTYNIQIASMERCEHIDPPYVSSLIRDRTNVFTKQPAKTEKIRVTHCFFAQPQRYQSDVGVDLLNHSQPSRMYSFLSRVIGSSNNVRYRVFNRRHVASRLGVCGSVYQ